MDETDLAPILERVSKAYEDSTLLRAYQARSVLQFLSGSVGEKRALQLLNGDGERVATNVELGPKKGHRVELGFMPVSYIWFESRELQDGIGYITFNMFMDPVRIMGRFGEAVQQFSNAPGIIIDLRGNPGGIGAMSWGMAGWFVDKKEVYLGTMSTRDTDLKFVVFPRPRPYAGKVAILVDGLSGSTSEIFAGGMKDIGRARIFGTRTAAAALPSVFVRLPNGDGFQYAMANYVSAGGEALEGNGVEPDVEVFHSREALLAERDLAIESAVAWIQDTGATVSALPAGTVN